MQPIRKDGMPFVLNTLSTSSKSTELQKAMDRISRKTFNSGSKSLNRVSQYNLAHSQIKDISKKVFYAISKQRPSASVNVLNIIKRKPHRLRLGQTNKASSDFNKVTGDFYTNFYRQKIPNILKLSLSSNHSEPQINKWVQNTSSIRISNPHKKQIELPRKYSSKESIYVKKLDSIIIGCNFLLKKSK